MIGAGARKSVTQGVLVALVAFVCVGAAQASRNLEPNTCVLANNGAQLSLENQTRLALSVTQAGQQITFTCPDGAPLDPSRATVAGRYYAASADGKCLSSQNTLTLGNQVPGAYVSMVKGTGITATTYALFVPVLPPTAQTLCFLCSGKANHKQDCPIVVDVAARKAVRSSEGKSFFQEHICDGEGEKHISVVEPQALTLQCGTKTPTLDPTVKLAQVYTGADCSGKATLATEISGATLEEAKSKPEEQNQRTQTGYVLTVTQMPETTKQICLKCIGTDSPTPKETCTFKIAVGKNGGSASAGFGLSAVTGVAVSVFVLATASLIQ
ncbi:SRS domain-containing protein [Neospora caninum Liverpool]|uniref:SRS domain-containing protein n=1 Tax=Neospora caninum (strain Liverpool) TaxID=572307 RepID=F0VFT0_NEOCL|nr:SRS domain-containing protein [Neospora caninum Liverpool]CBZ52574.1 SRS domain-containing protein [Neospora caninum Liverpool]CEL66550.1 TPA: SRS domain-containing protein [Neospora caninum Liverpool]|eukprot:XP_003882606.1 SRS domain-containing protein [Neospora caninum Liverpool]